MTPSGGTGMYRYTTGTSTSAGIGTGEADQSTSLPTSPSSPSSATASSSEDEYTVTSLPQQKKQLSPPPPPPSIAQTQPEILAFVVSATAAESAVSTVSKSEHAQAHSQGEAEAEGEADGQAQTKADAGVSSNDVTAMKANQGPFEIENGSNSTNNTPRRSPVTTTAATTAAAAATTTGSVEDSSQEEMAVATSAAVGASSSSSGAASEEDFHDDDYRDVTEGDRGDVMDIDAGDFIIGDNHAARHDGHLGNHNDDGDDDNTGDEGVYRDDVMDVSGSLRGGFFASLTSSGVGGIGAVGGASSMGGAAAKGAGGGGGGGGSISGSGHSSQIAKLSSRTIPLNDGGGGSDRHNHGARSCAMSVVSEFSQEDLEICQQLDLEYDRALEEREIGYNARYQSVRQSACFSVTFMLLYLVAGVLFFNAHNGWTITESLFFSVYTITTVGFGYGSSFIPTDPTHQIFTICFIFIGIATLTIMVAQVYQCIALEATRAQHARDKAEMSRRADASDGHRGVSYSAGAALSAGKSPTNSSSRRDGANTAPDSSSSAIAPSVTRRRWWWCNPWNLSDYCLDGFLHCLERSKNFFREHEFGRGLSVLFPLGGLVLVGAVVVGPLEEWSIVESIYFACVSLTTVGYGEYTPQNKASLWFCIFWLPFSVGFMSIFLGNVASFYIRLSDKNILRLERQMRRRIDAAKRKAEQERSEIRRRAHRGGHAIEDMMLGDSDDEGDGSIEGRRRRRPRSRGGRKAEGAGAGRKRSTAAAVVGAIGKSGRNNSNRTQKKKRPPKQRRRRPKGGGAGGHDQGRGRSAGLFSSLPTGSVDPEDDDEYDDDDDDINNDAEDASVDGDITDEEEGNSTVSVGTADNTREQNLLFGSPNEDNRDDDIASRRRRILENYNYSSRHLISQPQHQQLPPGPSDGVAPSGLDGSITSLDFDGASSIASVTRPQGQTMQTMRDILRAVKASRATAEFLDDDQSLVSSSARSSVDPSWIHGSFNHAPTTRADASAGRKPSFALRALVQERFAEIIATDIAGYQSHIEIKENTLSVTIDTLKQTADKWSVPRRARRAFRAVAFEALYFVGEHGLITRGADALFDLSPFEFHGLFSPLLAAMGDADTMDGWMHTTHILADVDLRRDGTRPGLNFIVQPDGGGRGPVGGWNAGGDGSSRRNSGEGGSGLRTSPPPPPPPRPSRHRPPPRGAGNTLHKNKKADLDATKERFQMLYSQPETMGEGENNGAMIGPALARTSQLT